MKEAVFQAYQDDIKEAVEDVNIQLLNLHSTSLHFENFLVEAIYEDVDTQAVQDLN